MFKHIKHISDVHPFVREKKEIRFFTHENSITVVSYMFMDSKTFDTPEAIECRGIAFDASGAIVSRPLHKFFNVGEKDYLSPDRLIKQDDIAAIFDKLDGSMIATAWVDGKLAWRSKKSFNSDVVKLAIAYLDKPENKDLKDFSEIVASNGMTAIFELTHPEARIVVSQREPKMSLLHVRDNITGEYVMLDPDHEIHDLIELFMVKLVIRHEGISFAAALESLDCMENREGYVIQFTNGDMAKLKCPWYLRLHHCITFLRERDIATLALNEELDDVKSTLVEAGIDLSQVNEVEGKLKVILNGLVDNIESAYSESKHLNRKDFAIANKDNPLFGMIMNRYIGRELSLTEWYMRNRLKDDFSLRTLANDAIEEALNG